MRTSLVMPTWNAGPLLDEVLASILALEGTRFDELRAVDSGSTDGTQERLRDAGFDVEVIPQSEFDHGSTRGAKSTLALSLQPSQRTLISIKNFTKHQTFKVANL